MTTGCSVKMKKILIVDDNLELSWVIAECLNRGGYKTLTAGSGAEGIKSALSFLPDLVLLDYNLGDMNGHDVAMAIRNMHKTSRIPFLILSAHGADPLLARSFEKIPNCRGAMSKVLSTREIVKAVEHALHAAPKAATHAHH
jgi:CheY-like chemotaxis protein